MSRIEKAGCSAVMRPILIFLIIFVGCSDQGGAHEQKVGRPPVAIEAITIKPGIIEEIIEVVGTLAPKYQAELKPEYVAVVREVYVKEWVRVKKGDKLAQMDIREPASLLNKALAAVETAKANMVQAQVALQRSEREFQRAIKLRQSGSVSQQTLDDAISEKDACAARLGAAKAQLNLAQREADQAKTHLDKATITAPIDGVVSYQGLMVGDLAGEMNNSHSVTRIIDTQVLTLTVTVPSREMAALKVGQPLIFTSDAFPGRVFNGTVMFINPVVNDVDRSVKIEAEVPNHEEVLKGGLFVKGTIKTGLRENVLLAPKDSLFSWDLNSNTAKVWVVSDQKAVSRQVSTGKRQGDTVEITRGLTIGERIVTRGAFNLLEGDKIKLVKVEG
ncbi:MAG: efflux RND transporter periplasmic adaptor subunit [Deltaproteobacteria bacterium]|nr:efflux RND transporter periplasmic adaptor subunit [Deltaproteobacteria bacterium]